MLLELFVNITLNNKLVPMHNKISQQYAERYILGGKAKVMFKNIETGNKYWFRVQETKDNVWKIYLIHGIMTMTTWLGNMGPDRLPHLHAHSRSDLVQAGKVFAWVWKHIRQLDLPDKIEIWHEGRCSVCGRPLTNEQSLIDGMGPICSGRLDQKLKI